jgi:soluble lytic murein transglycosylase-like protein
MALAPAAHATSMVSERAASCIESAAMYHHVNARILTAIVIHESRGRASTVSRNTNGSVDVGLTGINSVHFRELQQKGVAPEHLLDECVSVYVGAWTYSKKVFKYGNTWQAVGAYHSETPVYGQRYQTLIYNTMIRMGP